MIYIIRPLLFVLLAVVLMPRAAMSSPIPVNLAGPDWIFDTEQTSVTSGAQFHNGPTCSGSGPIVVQAIADPVDICTGVFTQMLATTPGQTYRVTYDFSIDMGNYASPGDFFSVFGGTAYLPGTALIQTGPSTYAPAPAGFLDNPPANCSSSSDFCGALRFGLPSDYPFQGSQEEFLATATGTSTTFEFAGACLTCEFGVGGVSVVAVPEPPAAPLIIVSTLACGVIALRRRTGRPTASCSRSPEARSRW